MYFSKKTKIIIIVAIILLLWIYFLKFFFPIVTAKVDVPEEIYDSITSYATGEFSDALPLLPVYCVIDEKDDLGYHFTIYYFPLGWVSNFYGDEGISDVGRLNL